MVQQNTQERNTIVEKIHFDFTLDAFTNTNANPTIEIYLDGETCIPKTQISSKQKISFDIELKKNHQQHRLTMYRANHSNKGEQILKIEKLEADGINLNKLLDNFYFYPIYPNQWYKEQLANGTKWPEKQKGWRDLGFNGKWVMEFTTPFYTWLLKNT